MGRVGRGEPRNPRANQITPRVISRKGTRKPISGGSEVFVPDSTGTAGPKGREGREKPADP
ncbi:hypothetical protein KI387_009538, partial [Taxus chinensis]